MTSKVDPRSGIVNIYNGRRPISYVFEKKREELTKDIIYDDFKLKYPFGIHGLYGSISALQGLNTQVKALLQWNLKQWLSTVNYINQWWNKWAVIYCAERLSQQKSEHIFLCNDNRLCIA